MTPPKYVIINDIDAPSFPMVCQFVPHVGYCYLDRTGTKPRYDGMTGREATAVEDFGIAWTDNDDGTVSFYVSDRAPTATYTDGAPRRWQGAASAEYRRLTGPKRPRRARVEAQD